MNPLAIISLAVAGFGGLIFWLRRSRRQQNFIVQKLAAPRSPNDTRRIIVSLSTLPDRIMNLRPTLESLIQQTRPPDEIVLALPEFSIRQNCAYLVPVFLRDFPRLRILHADRDWGPATKSIPVIRDELAADRTETLLMVVDDDRIYPRDAIETYLHFNTQLPDAALCFRGAAMPNSFDWREAKMQHGHLLRAPRRVAVITGAGSYLLKPKFFDAAFWSYSGAPDAAFYMDDIWISGCLDRRGVEKYVVPSSTKLRSVQEQARAMTLHEVPRGRQTNNNEVIAYFQPGWKVLEKPASTHSETSRTNEC